MLKRIDLDNFKSFRRLDGLEIKPITILCGANSCGKSSVLQSLLLLKQTKESRNPSQPLLLNGNYVHMGDIKDLIHGEVSEEMRIGQEYEFTSRQLYSGLRTGARIPVHHVLRYLISRTAGNINNIHTISFSASFKPAKLDKGYIQTADIDTYEFWVSTQQPDGEKIPGAHIKLKKNKSKFSISWDNIQIRNRAGITSRAQSEIDELESGEIRDVNVYFENFYPIIEDSVLLEDSDEKRVRVPIPIRNMIRAMDDFLISMNDSLTYVGPLRVAPSRRYIYENEVLEIGTKGENAAYIYQTEHQNKISGHYFLSEDELSFKKIENISLKNALDSWLALMSIRGFEPNYESEIIRLNMNANPVSDMKVNIADVGFGVSQIFPILLEGLRMQKNGTLLLEQPEIHLHPKLQMQMADYFISLALSKKNTIIETHSDHIVNRLVRRILEDEDHSLSEMIAIYFVSNIDGESKVERIRINSETGIENWPVGFLIKQRLSKKK